MPSDHRRSARPIRRIPPPRANGISQQRTANGGTPDPAAPLARVGQSSLAHELPDVLLRVACRALCRQRHDGGPGQDQPARLAHQEAEGAEHRCAGRGPIYPSGRLGFARRAPAGGLGPLPLPDFVREPNLCVTTCKRCPRPGRMRTDGRGEWFNPPIAPAAWA